jgi:hypothetical protein
MKNKFLFITQTLVSGDFEVEFPSFVILQEDLDLFLLLEN